MIGLLAFIALTQAAPAPHARVTLVAEHTALVPAQENLVGIRFELDAGWHMFWENPGDAGAAPRVQWRLPAGYTAGPLVYPAPDRIRSGSFTIYGYERDTMLLTSIRVPDARPGTSTISADVRFILCSDVCIPADAKPSITLPVGSGTASSAKALFDSTRARVPQPAPASWSARAELTKEEVIVTLTNDQPVTPIEVFPLEPGVVDASTAARVEPVERGVRIRMKRSDDLIQAPKTLPLVIELRNGKAVTITAPVTGAVR
jgi:DsbC/DsbD-like thiol-disulfide interchange protein